MPKEQGCECKHRQLLMSTVIPSSWKSAAQVELVTTVCNLVMNRCYPGMVKVLECKKHKRHDVYRMWNGAFYFPRLQLLSLHAKQMRHSHSFSCLLI